MKILYGLLVLVLYIFIVWLIGSVCGFNDRKEEP